VLIGLSPAGEKAEVELPRLFAKRARILTSHGGDHLPHEDFPRLAQWALDGKLDLAGMVTRRISLEDAPDALEQLKSSPDLIRSVIVF
jgi:S-(hydroxymethyl)glutathione dehydrogenase/alcohol dehydrogenase